MRTPKSDWTDLLLAFRLVLDPRKLWLSFKGVVLTVLLVGFLLGLFACIHRALGISVTAPASETTLAGGGRLIEEMGGRSVGDTDVFGALQAGRFGDAVRATAAFVDGLAAKAGSELRAVARGRHRSPYDRLVALWGWGSQGLMSVAALGLLALFVLLFVWSYYGSAIMRLAAVEYALGVRIEMQSAKDYTRRKHQSFYGPPLGLAVAVFLLGLGLGVAGLLVWNALALIVALIGLAMVAFVASVVRDRSRSVGAGLAAGAAGLVALAGVLCAIVCLGLRVPYVGEVMLGLLSPLALAGGLVMAIILVWVALGVPLMAATVATADVGAFDAWSRSFHYLFVHPWRCAFYAAVGAGHGLVCLGFVYLVRLVAEWAALAPLSVGAIMMSGREAEPIIAFFLAADCIVLDLVFLAFVAAYFFTSQAIAYLLLRRVADGTPIRDVHLEPRDRERIAPPQGASEP